MKKKYISFAIIASLALILTGCRGNDALPPDKQVDYENDVRPLIEEKEGQKKSRGSCNAIGFGSQCIDYVGSMWTDEQMKLNCQGEGRSFSKDACPYPENGGCNMGADTITEIVAWNYPYGGDPVTGGDLESAVGACNLTVGSKWVKPDDFWLAEKK
jgi:hypothetical protein